MAANIPLKGCAETEAVERRGSGRNGLPTLLLGAFRPASEPTEQFGLLRGELLVGEDAALVQSGQRLDGRDDGSGIL